MFETPVSAVAIIAEPARAWTAGVLQAGANAGVRTATWFVDVAQQFGSLLSAIMGPAVLAAYSFAVWSLAANLGWTDTFPYSAGPLSNWLIWAGMAIAIHCAASVLRRHIRIER